MSNPLPSSAVPALTIRARVFVDFWNYELSMKLVDPNFLTDWRTVGRILAGEAVRLIEPTALMEISRD